MTNAKSGLLSLGLISFGATLAGDVLHWFLTSARHHVHAVDVVLMCVGGAVGVLAFVYGMRLQRPATAATRDARSVSQRRPHPLREPADE